MPFTYVNRRGKVYYIHEGKTKTGKPKYYVSLKNEGNILDAVPDGFEIYEAPENAQAYLRKIQPQLITDLEINIVDKAIKELTDLKYYKISCKKNTISVYIPDQNIDALKIILEELRQFTNKGAIDDVLKQTITYSEKMQFILHDSKKRIFVVRRCLYEGSFDDWLLIGGPDTLKNLAEKYVVELEENSLF